MKKYFVPFLFIFFIFVLISSAQNKSESIKYIKANLEFLASAELEGREATSRAEKVASQFIATELKKYGVKPFGDDGTYFNNFEMVVASVNDNSTISFYGKDNSRQNLTLGNDFYLMKNPLPDQSFTKKNYEMVFAGYGIISEEENYNDYKNLDVKGKVVVIVSGTPLESQNYLTDKNLRKLKLAAAKNLGAAGIIYILEKPYFEKWHVLQNIFSETTYLLKYEVDADSKNNIPLIILSREGADKLLSGETTNYEKLMELFSTKGKKKTFAFNKTVSFDYFLNIEIKQARNVVGILEGTDEKLKNEYVLTSCHYDHEGIKNGEIYFGADDNGSGTSGVLEVARRLSEAKKNKRSVLFVFHTAEEKGVFGSKFLANHADHIINNSVVDINIDMIGRESIDSIYNIGSGKLSTELYNLVREVNSETTNFVFNYHYDMPNDPEDMYNRSDHVHYSNKGIPIVFFYDKMTVDYHKPTDTADKINYDKIYKVTQLVENLALRIANLDHKLKVDKPVK